MEIIAAFFATFIFGYIVGRRRRKIKEITGEGAVRKLLVKHCKSSTSHVLNNVTLPYKDGTTQIDHILVTKNGVLVIETKHYSGWLFANDSQKYWTQVIYRFKKKFQNPLLQNRKHVNAVRNLLDFMPGELIQSLVVFTGKAKFKTMVPSGVVKLKQLLPYIDEMRFGDISENRVQFCVGRLEHNRFEITKKTDIEHQRYLEKKFGEIE